MRGWEKNEVRPLPGVLFQSIEWTWASRTWVTESLGRPSAPCPTDAPSTPNWLWSHLPCCYLASLISKMKPKDSGIYPSKLLPPVLNNSHCSGSPCSAWLSLLAYLLLPKELSLSSILEYLENPGYHVLHPQIFSVSIMLRALSVSVRFPGGDSDFTD